ncbi:MAG: glycosyltransferase [Ignavibacteriae bacterium]|nr:glycosyltransferase [Ignavibacteriota bacterium]
MQALYAIFLLFQAYISFQLILPLMLIVLSAFRKLKKLPSQDFGRDGSETDFAVIITAYKEADIVVPLVDSLIKQKYTKYTVYVVADECDTSKFNFTNDKVKVLKPDGKIGSKFKSILYAIKNFTHEHEALVIFDADNLVHPEFLRVMNRYFKEGYKAVQGIRLPKNLDTDNARLDAAGDMFYNYYDRRLCFKAGSSSALAGSGMGFDLNLYGKLLKNKIIVGGFDKVLQAEIVMMGYRIAFAPAAVVYDEKVSKGAQVVKQRTRWLNSWFKYFLKGFVILGTGFVKFDINRVLFGIMLIRPPLFIFTGFSVFFLIVNVFISPLITLYWSILLILFALSFLFSMKQEKADSEIWKSMIKMPVFVFYLFLSLARIRRANKKFLETEHTKLMYIEDITGKEIISD